MFVGIDAGIKLGNGRISIPNISREGTSDFINDFTIDTLRIFPIIIDIVGTRQCNLQASLLMDFIDL